MRALLVRRCKFFIQEESGAVTVEAVLWIPFFFGVLMLITDVSLAFFSKAQAFRIVQDANRALSVGRISSASAAETAIETAFESLSPSSNATVKLDNGLITTVMTIPMSEIVLFLDRTPIAGKSVTVGAQHYYES